MTRGSLPYMLRWSLVAACVSIVAGCASTSIAQRPVVPQGDKCLALYEKVDEHVEAAGVMDAAYHRIPGFPYLRTDRYTASFAHELPDMETFWEWVGYLRALEDESREVELRNLGLGDEDASALLLDMRSCGGWLRSWELDDAAFREKMIEAVKVPDDYSTSQRVLGLYSIAVPFLKQELSALREDVERRFQAPLETPPAPAELTLWTAQENPERDYAEGTIDLRRKPRDLLGRVGLVWSEIVHLAHTHAPALWIESAGDHDRPAMAVQTATGPGADASRPAVYFLMGLTRFGGRSLLQITYFVWFSGKASDGEKADGKLDGLIWRVTLDEKGQPLVHDTIHASGGAHFVFPVPPLQRREAAPEWILFPQEQGAPPGSVAVRLRSGTHDVTRVVRADEAAAAGSPGRTYELRSYEELLNLPTPEGGTRSFFGPDGFIVGTERSQHFWSWSSGVRNPGALRQWGHHPTAPYGRAHFDDPFLFDQTFVMPAVPPTMAEARAPAP